MFSFLNKYISDNAPLFDCYVHAKLQRKSKKYLRVFEFLSVCASNCLKVNLTYSAYWKVKFLLSYQNRTGHKFMTTC